MEKRLMEGALDGFEKELLHAAKQDVLPEGRRQLLMGAMGVSGVGIASAVGLAASEAGGAVAQGAVVQGAVAQGAATHAAIAAKAPAAQAAAAGSKLLAGKLVIGKAGAIAGAIGAAGALTVLAAVGVGTPEPPPATPKAPPAAIAAPVQAERQPVVDPIAVVEPVAVDETEEQEQAEAPVTSSRKASAPSGPSAADTLTRELALIDSARQAVARGDGRGALRQLDTYSRRYPKGTLRTEAGVLRIEALIASGDRAGAKRLGNAFLLRSPNGPYARRIRSLLGKGERPSEP